MKLLIENLLELMEHANDLFNDNTKPHSSAWNDVQCVWPYSQEKCGI